MSQLLVRNLDPGVKERLKDRARRHGRSMEAEVRSILGEAVSRELQPSGKLSEQIASLFKGIGLKPGEELERLPPMVLKSPFDDDHR
jgi:plasmid stability protein